MAAKFELFWPVTPVFITQPFGVNGEYYREHGINIAGHNGLDFAAYDGQPIRAAHDGVVTFTGEDGSAGLGVVIRTNEPREYGSGESYFKTIYWHCKKGSFRVKPGDQVKVGDVLALADNTGLSTGTHLHFGLKPVAKGEADWSWHNVEQENGYLGAIDPRPFFGGLSAEIAGEAYSLIARIRAFLARYFPKVGMPTHSNMNNKPWYVSSSGEGLSLTLQGLSVAGLGELLEQLLALAGHPVLPGSVTDFLTATIAAVAALMTAGGLARKLWYQFARRTA